jgi:hypothetical protein
VAIFLLTAICNLIYVYRWRFHEERASLILLVGGAAALVGLVALPILKLNQWFWLPLLADIGVPYCAGLLLLLFKKLVRYVLVASRISMP